MAKKSKRRYSTYKSKRRSVRRKRGYSKSDLKDLAYKMGLVKRGLNNPNSQVTEAYNRGLVKPEQKEKKTLL